MCLQEEYNGAVNPLLRKEATRWGKKSKTFNVNKGEAKIFVVVFYDKVNFNGFA